MKKGKIFTTLILSLYVLTGCSKDDDAGLPNLAPDISDQSFTIAENISVGSLIGKIEASDADDDSLTFSIVSGNSDETFQLDAKSGELTLEKPLDYQTASIYELSIEVSDGQSVNSAVITMTITEVSETGLFDRRLQFGNLEREYLLYIPESYTGDEPLPLVFSLHGAGGSKESQFELSEFDQLAESENFILITPEATALSGPLTFWNQNSAANRPDDVGFINALIDEIAGSYEIDLDRIYLAGSSNGAFMALEIVCRLDDRIAAVAAVKGYMLPDQISACNPSKPTAIIQMHGTEDPLVAYDGVEATIQYWSSFNQTDSDVLITDLPDINPNNGNTAIRYLYANGTNGVEVQHLQVINGVHDWFGEPGTNYDFNASEEAWAFFKRFDINGLK